MKSPLTIQSPDLPSDYFNGTLTNWNTPTQGDHIVRLPPPPGLMGTPPGGVPGWAPPPPLPAANTSSEYSSGISGNHHTPTQPQSPLGLGNSQSSFTYEELAKATGGFSQANLLGQGGFGFVHKGVLPNGKEVAVKSLKVGSGQGEREFQAEVDIISRVHHRHLVSLVGYCIVDGQRMLVYEFVPNKTMEYHLHGKGQPTMDWATRLRIAMGSAKGLAYLHEDCHPKIIHRDIKAANILLDYNYEAMVADFGLAKLSSDNYTHVSTRARPLLSRAMEDGNYDELVDPQLENNYLPLEMARVVSCAAASIRHSARRRPKMSQIVRALEGDSSLNDLNEGVKPGQSSTYSSNGSSSTPSAYDTGAYNADMLKFRKMVLSSQDFNSSEYGATSEYGLNPSTSSSEEMGHSGITRDKL
ncbi:hypothetical protein C3L33_18358, partial [Rhododendron williamsianum]